MKKPKVVQEDFPPEDKYDDFDIIRGIVNLTRQYPKSSGKFIRSELREQNPGITDSQIARCCERITERWEPERKPLRKGTRKIAND
jgi:hypothetical protein